MKNSSFPARMLSLLLLAVAVLFGLASLLASASSNTLRYQQVDNSSSFGQSAPSSRSGN